MEFFRLCLHWQCGIHGYGEPHHNIATVAFFLDVIEEIYNKDASLFIYLKKIFIYLGWGSDEFQDDSWKLEGK